jgi:adenylate kinase family enzyme
MVADYEKTRKKKDPELDRTTIKVRLPDDVLIRLVRLSMNSAACKNKGFILDGYPRN